MRDATLYLGRRRKNDVLEEQLAKYKRIFEASELRLHMLSDAFREYAANNHAMALPNGGGNEPQRRRVAFAADVIGGDDNDDDGDGGGRGRAGNVMLVT